MKCTDNVKQAITMRRTVRSFTSQKVEREQLEQVVEAARYAPSGMNCQSYLFLVLTGESLEFLRVAVRDYFRQLKITADMPPFFSVCKKNAEEDNWSFFYHAPALILVANRRDYRNAMADCAAATMNGMIMAQALGLSSGWITTISGNTRQPAIRTSLTALGVPEDYDVFTSMTVGYAAEVPECAPRTSQVIWKN